jgi:hypothetical protein
MVRPIVLLATLVGAVTAGGCYDPRVTSGQLRCNADRCPDGFVCSANLCVTRGAGTGGAGGRAGTGGAGGGGGAGGSCQDGAPRLCSSVASGGACDPVCQAGCPCGLSCGWNGTAFACAPDSGVKKQEGDVCAAVDDCAPGLLCLAETCGTSLRRCHRACADALASTVCQTVCNPPPDGTALPGGVKACGSPIEPCDPYSPGNNGCRAPGLYCITDGSSRTYCDCPVPAMAGGGQTEGAPCTGTPYCAAGLVCLRPPPTDMARCYRLCKPLSTSTCMNCTSFLQVGYCPLP